MKLFPILLLMFSALDMAAQHKVLKQGHRGCRGLMPENTIEAMQKALDLGVDVLELDVVISKDKQVVVSHDTYMSADFCLKPSGDSITAEEQKSIILYAMPYSEIRRYDAGSKHNKQFPEQQNFKTYKPLLSALIDAAEAHAKQKGMPSPHYNIEIKSSPKEDGVHHPAPAEFVGLVLKVCRDKGIVERMNIQSFDVRPLKLIHQQDPSVKLSYLTANTKTIAENIKELGFTPDIYSPYYKTVNKEAVAFCHQQNMQIVPWTPNTKEEIDALTALGVDAIITDYPNLF